MYSVTLTIARQFGRCAMRSSIAASDYDQAMHELTTRALFYRRKGWSVIGTISYNRTLRYRLQRGHFRKAR
jgi:hypothetical protein